MGATLFEQRRNELILVARVLMMILFVASGWSKLTDFSGTVAYMAAEHLPLPTITAVIVIVIELLVGLALVVGFLTRPLALLMAVYTLGTAFIGHHYWTLAGPERAANLINFYKNISIVGGLLLLCAAGPGRYSVDRE